MQTATKKIIISILANLIICFNVSAINDALKIKITSGSLSDETVVRFLPTATEAFDGSYDAYKMFSPSTTVPSIYTNIDAVTHLSINALPTFSSLTNIELYTQIQVTGIYTIQSIELGTGFSQNIKIVLEDKETGLSYDFRNGKSVSLMLNTNTISTANRFSIHFSPPIIVNTNNISCFESNDGKISLIKAGNHNWNYELKDQSSSVIFAENNINESTTILNLAPGTYFLYISSIVSLQDSAEITITEPAQVISNFTIDNDNVYLPAATITFNNGSLNSTIYNWDFGDGISADSISPVHQYTSAGNYLVTLTAANANGCSSTFSRLITVNEEVATGIFNQKANPNLTIILVDNQVHLTSRLTSVSKVLIIVYNSYGQAIYNYSNDHSVDLTQTIELNHSGTYIVNSVINNVPNSQKFIYIK